ncbi:MAG: peptidylprolyl isomerase [Alistipes sp.]|nr:peptidylprolyl isomerase [Alistipes sp.]
MIRKIMYVAVAATLFMLTLSSASAQQRRQVMLDKVVAVVGGSAILHSELVEYAEALVSQRRQMGYTSDRDPLDESLEALLEQKLLYNQALIDSVEVNTSDIASRIEVYVQAQIAEEGGIAQLEAKEHMPIYTYRELLRQRYEEQAYAQAMRNDVVSRVTVVPGEVERFYKHVDKDSLPVIGEQYVYAHITKFPSSLKDAQQRTKERLLDMRERVITGQTKFSVLARMYSLDGSAMYGGEMEPMPASYFVRPFAEALEKLKPGQISEIVETEFGFHIIELIEKKNDLYRCRHILLRPTFTREELMEPANLHDSIANLIRLDSISFDKAALQFSDDATSKHNGGIVSNSDILERMGVYDGARMTATRFLKEDFSAQGGKSLDDYAALMRLKVGEVSNSFQTTDIMGNEMSKIVKLVEIIPAHTASLEEDYIRLEEMALQQKQEKIYKEWLNDKIMSMYVYIDPAYRTETFENKNWIK